jgi:peptidoglycan/xylan/chitin deacetylase (PgdA/CDA1 family)
LKLKIQPPVLLRLLYPGAIWRLNRNDKVVYLSFDDGPTAEVTSWVLDLLHRENIKATFFCLGKNVDSEPDLYHQLIERGHCIGNHSQNHLRAFSVSHNIYVSDAELAAQKIRSKLFRPPYGQLRFSAFRKLRKHYKVVFWDVLSEDYNDSVSPEQVVNNVMHYARNGSVIVFHDSVKAFPRLKIALPEIIRSLKAKGYSFDVIPD